MAAAPSGVTTMEGERLVSNGAAGTRPNPDAAAAAAPSAARAFVRRHLLTLAPYTPIEPFEVLSARLGRSTDDIIKLDANENPYGPPPEVLTALGSMAFPNIYPDPANRRLRDAIAAHTGVPAQHLLVRSRGQCKPAATSADTARHSAFCHWAGSHRAAHLGNCLRPQAAAVCS